MNAANPFGIFDASQPVRRTSTVPHPGRAVEERRLPSLPMPDDRQNPQPSRMPGMSSLKQTRQKQVVGWLKRGSGIVLVMFMIFALLPASLQKRCYALLGLRSVIPITSGVSVPVPYAYVSSPFGRRWGRQHQGIDLAAPYAAPIYAASAGTVVHSGWEAGYGNSVIIDHGHGMQTRYAHCSRLLVSEGQAVEKGTLIAKVGSTGHSTGPHLHFEVLVNGVRKNPAWYYDFPGSGAEQLAKAAN